MKNIFLIPTKETTKLGNKHLYIISFEEIKSGDFIYDMKNNKILKAGNIEHCNYFKHINKIILTTDQELINEGVQPVDDNFLKWFKENPYYDFVSIYTVLQKRHGLDWHDLPNKKSGNEIDGIYRTINKIEIPEKLPIGNKNIEDAAHKWVFETNSHKWSNNDNTAGDNYGSFLEGSKCQKQISEKENTIFKDTLLNKIDSWIREYQSLIDYSVATESNKEQLIATVEMASYIKVKLFISENFK